MTNTDKKWKTKYCYKLFMYRVPVAFSCECGFPLQNSFSHYKTKSIGTVFAER